MLSQPARRRRALQEKGYTIAGMKEGTDEFGLRDRQKQFLPQKEQWTKNKFTPNWFRPAERHTVYSERHSGEMNKCTTIVRIAEDEYYLVSAGAWQAYDSDYLQKAVEDKIPEFGYMSVQDVTSNGAYSPSQVQSHVMC